MTEPASPDHAHAVAPQFSASEEENPHAGKGAAVMLDIGDDVGAVVVICPEALLGREIEIVPVGSREPGGRYEHAAANEREHGHHHHHDDDHGHTHDDDHGHGDDHGHSHHPDAPPHVGVVARPLGDRMVPSAIFAEVVEGRYELSLRPFEAVGPVVEVTGGQVTELTWPAP